MEPMDKSEVAIGQLFAEALNPRETWRVEKILVDNMHAVIVTTGQMTRRKTISKWALLNTRFYQRPVPAGR
jgi:hypothetical protein